MAKHHLFSPSGASRRNACIGSVFGPSVSIPASDAMKEGTVCHQLLEYCVSLGMPPEGFLGEVITSDVRSDGKPFTVDEEMIEGVKYFLDTAAGLLAEYGIPPENVLSEQYLVHPDIPDELFGGTCDYIAWNDTTILTLDMKYGREPVPGNSPQLTEYLLLAIGSKKVMPANLSRMVQGVIQPRSYDDVRVKTHEVTIEDLNSAWQRINTAVHYYKQYEHTPVEEIPLEVFTTGGHCQRCVRADTCRALRQMNVDAFNAIESGVEDTIQSMETADQIREICKWMEREAAMKAFFSAMNKKLLVLAQNGHKVPGMKLVSSVGHRRWNNTVTDKELGKARNHLNRALRLKQGGLGGADLVNHSLKTPKQVEDMLKKAGLLKDKNVKEAFNRHVMRPVLGLRLVDASSKEPEVTADMIADLNKVFTEGDYDG